jgi:hypothetical protein
LKTGVSKIVSTATLGTNSDHKVKTNSNQFLLSAELYWNLTLTAAATVNKKINANKNKKRKKNKNEKNKKTNCRIGFIELATEREIRDHRCAAFHRELHFNKISTIILIKLNLTQCDLLFNCSRIHIMPHYVLIGPNITLILISDQNYPFSSIKIIL